MVCYISRLDMQSSQEDGGSVLRLHIGSTAQHDSGVYDCTATNQHGTATSHFTLLVQGA